MTVDEAGSAVSVEIVRRVKGRDYLYRVDSVPDVESVRARRARRRSSTSARDRIVRATIDLLASRDAEFLTVDVIARAAKLSRATFYRQFTDRECAFGAALEEFVAGTDSALPKLEPLEAILRPETERSRFAAWIAVLLERLGEHPTLLRRLVTSPAWYAPLTAVLARYLSGLRSRDALRCSDVELLARGVMLVIEGALVRGVLADHPSDAFAVAPAIAERLVFGA